MASETPKNRRKLPSSTRFAVWECHGKKCWMCNDPLRLLTTVVDHVIPHSLARKPSELARILEDLNLPADFNIDGFENLLPSCAPCNLRKGKRVFEPYPKHKLVLDDLAAKASWVRRTAEKTRMNVVTDRILNAIFVALEDRTMSMVDLERFLVDIVRTPDQIGVPDDVIILSDGYWYRRSSIVGEGHCRCEREICVDAESKVYCYFHAELSEWVITTGLYFRCYDELVTCSRCGRMHKRGHIGRSAACGRPFANQAAQTD